jgi:hypothetical protein
MAIATSPLYFEYPTGREPLYERQADGSVMVKPVGAFCWENSDECFHGTNHPLKLVASVAVVTDNPKVRNIQLYMNLRVTDANLFYGKSPRMSRFCGNNQNVYHLAEDYGGRVWQNCFEPEIVRKGSYYTYELINFKSRELAEFYNPLEHDQQQSMAKLVKDYLNPKLEEWGLAVEHAWFNIKPE